MTRRRVTTIALTAAALAAAPGIANAQDLGYESVPGVAGVSGGGGGGGERGEVASVTARGGDAGTLPFTGLELGAMLAGGLALLGSGVAIRRVARNH